jgi:quercetin dioxygenase-like cupin family protein
MKQQSRTDVIMKWSRFPERIKMLEPFSDRFDAFRLSADNCDVLFATYPAGSDIEPHSHDSDNWGVITKGEMIITMNGSEMTYGTGDWYHVPAGCRHAAKCFVETEEIEFWFDSQGR